MQFDWWTLALQAVNFLVLVWLLQRFLFRPVQRLIETRKAKSDELLHTAEGKLAEAEAERAHYEGLIASIEASKDAALKDFQKQLESERDAALAKAHEAAEDLVRAAKEEVAEDRRQAVASSRADLVSLAKEIASKILVGRAKEASIESDLSAALEKLAELPDRDRQRIYDHTANGTSGVTVETSEALDKGQQRDLVTTLQEEFGKAAQITFKVNPDLLGGVRLMLSQAQLDASWATYLDAAAERLLECGHEQ